MRIQYPANLPITARKDAIIQAIQEHQVVVVAGDTGSGKTTQLPKMCLEAGRAAGRSLIGCTQPRRIAAVSVTERVQEELGAAELVGYKIRFSDRTGPQTRIKFMTDGVLLAETQGDRALRRYDTIIIDEAHGRAEEAAARSGAGAAALWPSARRRAAQNLPARASPQDHCRHQCG